MNEFDRTKNTVDLAHVDKSHDGRVDLMRGVFCIVQTTAGGVTETRLVLQGLKGTAGNRKLVYRLVTDDWEGNADEWEDGPIQSKEEREIEAAVKRIRLGAGWV